jgi:hypothetical protein
MKGKARSFERTWLWVAEMLWIEEGVNPLWAEKEALSVSVAKAGAKEAAEVLNCGTNISLSV